MADYVSKFTAEFNAKNNASGELASYQKALADASEEIKKQQKEYENLAKSSDKAKDAMLNQANVLSELKTKLKETQTELNKNEKQIKDFQKAQTASAFASTEMQLALNELEYANKNYREELARNESQIKEQTQQLDKQTKEIERQAKAYDKLKASSKNANKQKEDESFIGKQKASIDDEISGIGRRFLAGALVVAAVQQIGEATKKMVDFTKSTIDAADGLQKLSDRTGISVEQLSVLQNAAKMADASPEDLQRGLKELNKNIQEAANGGEEAGNKFEELGINIRDSAGKVRPTIEIFREYADKIKNAADGPQRLAVATQLFGKAGESLIPMLKDGSAGLAAYQKEMERLGSVTTTAQANLSAKFNDTLSMLGIATQGLVQTILPSLIPPLITIVETLTEFVATLTNTGDTTNFVGEEMKKLGGNDGIGQLIIAFSYLVSIINFNFKTMMAVKLALNYVYDAVALVVRGFFSLGQIIGAILTGNFSEIPKIFGKLVDDVKSDVAKSTLSLVDFIQNKSDPGKAIRDSYNKVKGASKPVEDEAANATAAAKDAQGQIQETQKLAERDANRIITSIKTQIAEQSKLIDAANKKVADQVAAQKKVADEFEATVRRIQRANGPNLETRIDRLRKNLEAKKEADKKREDLDAKDAEKREQTEFEAKRKRLEDLANEARKKAEETGSSIDSAAAKQAELALTRLQGDRDEIERKRELSKIDDELAEKQRITRASATESLRVQSEYMTELRNISASIAQNKKDGIISEEEINKLKSIGKAIEDSLGKDDGLFSKSEAERFIGEVNNLAKTAAAANTEVAKKEAEKAILGPMAILQDLQEKLKQLRVNVDVDSVKKAAKDVYDEIQNTLSSKPFKINTLIADDGNVGSKNLTITGIPKYADGGVIPGYSGARSDKILAAVSPGEAVLNFNAVQAYGEGFVNALNSGSINPVDAMAIASGVSLTNNNNSNTVLNLNLPNGNVVNVSAKTKQSDLDRAALAKARLRRTSY